MMHFLILGLALILAVGVYAWGFRAPKEKWELVRTVMAGKAGLYKRRKYVKLGKYERVFTTYAVLRNSTPGKVWSFVWKIDRVARGGRAIGIQDSIPTAGQESLYEVGFAPPLGLYAVYTGEEDHLSYPEREKYLLQLYKKTSAQHKMWREDRAFHIRKRLSRWRAAIATFVVTSGVGLLVAPIDVEAPQVLVWTLIGMMTLGLLVGIGCMIRSQHAPMWAQASAGAFLAACLVGTTALPSLMLGTNALAFATLCEGSVPVERSWLAKTERGEVLYYADVTLPASCQFDAHRTGIGEALYHEFQAGRRVVDVVVSQGVLGYKRIKLIGA